MVSFRKHREEHHNQPDPKHPARRDLLRFVGMSGAAALALTAEFRGATPPPQAKTQSPAVLDQITNVDVVVIGGGFAGITAARECCHAGLRTVLLEARNRLGGRTFYSRFGDEPIELGGTWIHWFQPNVWGEVLHYGLEVDETPGYASPNRFMWLSGDRVIEPPLDQALATFTEVMRKFHQESPRIFPRPYDNFYNPDLVKKYDGMSIMDRINQLSLPPEQADLLISMMELCVSGPCKTGAYLEMAKWWALSGNDLALMNDAVGRYYFKHGTISLINAMVADASIPVFVSMPATRVKSDSNGVEVTTQVGKVVRARRAIVTVPLNVLKAIPFEPAIAPLRLEASRTTHAGLGTKVQIKVKGTVPSLAAQAHEPEPFSAFWTERSGAENSLLVAFGSSSKLIDVNNPEEVQKPLRKFLPNIEVLETLSYDWAVDPYSRGTWCVYRPNMLTRYLTALQQPEGNVFFASSDWANGWRGFIDGAIESGRNVGRAVVKSLRVG